MRPESYHAQDLVDLLRARKIATIGELKAALGTSADSTVFRKLSELDYHTSYSHRGRFYTLDEIARFDEMGLWSLRAVWFSVYGTLLATVEALVEAAQAGFDAGDLEAVVHVSVKAPLIKLVRQGRLARQQVAGRYVYVSADPATSRSQLSARRVYDAQASAAGLGVGVGAMPDELKAAVVLFFGLLDEQQRRLYAGLEALKIGHGGDSQIASLLGIDPSTVARGRRQLLDHDVEVDRVRREGGGRQPVEKKRRRSSPQSRR